MKLNMVKTNWFLQNSAAYAGWHKGEKGRGRGSMESVGWEGGYRERGVWEIVDSRDV